MPNIKFGNIDFSGDGAYIWGSGQYSAPSRSVDFISVDGRNGDLVIDNGNYNNIKANFGVAIVKNVPENTDKLKYLLYSQKGYQKLYDSDHKGFYRLACFSEGFDITSTEKGVVEIEFDCKPLKYDITGDIAVVFENEGNLVNKYFEPSRPLITVFGSGSGTLRIGNQNIHFTDIDEYVTVDTEIQYAFKGVVNKNHTINNADVVLVPQNNHIYFSGGITKVEIKPRWVTI